MRRAGRGAHGRGLGRMPRFFCDYCDTYLTHDSAAGRKQHMRGWKHREAVKQYYDPVRPNYEAMDRQ